MSRLESRGLAIAALFLALGAARGGAEPSANFGRPLEANDLKGAFAIPPSGAGLPPGQGTPSEGKAVFAEHCAACHGDKLQGIKSTGAAALVGGRGSLTEPKPVKTVESYWPYATTLFDYVKRAMPFDKPGSLSDDQTYAVVAYLLSEGHVVEGSQIMNATTLPLIKMPNRDGFVPDPRPR